MYHEGANGPHPATNELRAEFQGYLVLRAVEGSLRLKGTRIWFQENRSKAVSSNKCCGWSEGVSQEDICCSHKDICKREREGRVVGGKIRVKYNPSHGALQGTVGVLLWAITLHIGGV